MDYLNYTFNSNKQCKTSGIDSILHLDGKNLDSFIKYPYPISYKYNSRGFRGPEWPEDLTDVIWCIGDSFTSGIGVPFNHTWPSILQTKIKLPCINLGIDGAANGLILNIAKQVASEYNPKYMVIMWSFPWRRYYDPWQFIQFEVKENNTDNINNFKSCFNQINDLIPNIYNTIIPRLKLPVIKNLKANLYEYELLDVARDNFHFDHITAETIANSIVSHFNIED